MEFLALVTTPIWGFIASAVPFLLVLTVIVFVHEYGHFQVARWCGVGVETFAVGFGKEIFGRTDKHGTRWKLGWIPIGGYVKFEDDANAASMPSDEAKAGDEHTPEPSETAFHNKPLASRIAVVAAGPMANFIMAIVIFAVTFMTIGAPVSLPIAESVQPGSAAEQAGIQAGDRFVEIDGYKIDKFADIQARIWNNQGDPMAITIERDGKTISLSVAPIATETTDITGSKVIVRRLGVKSGRLSTERKGPIESVALA
ncbi:MAG: M50 family metallopeptidase, partial [Aestuariivirgaceae bacterium]